VVSIDVPTPQLATILDVLADDAILLVFVTVGVGAGLGAVRIKGVALGPAMALFVGLGIGAVDESLSSADGLDLLRELGLVLFTYTVGLASGPTFLTGLRRGGVKALGVTTALVIALAGMSMAVAEVFDLTPADRAGLFAGSATNTPSLQAAAEAVTTGDPVVAYSLAYPAAVASMLVVVTLLLGRHLPLPANLELPAPPVRSEPIVNWTVLVTTESQPTLGELRHTYPGITFSRVEHGGVVRVATADQRVAPGDRLVVIGPEPAVGACCQHLGERSDRHLALDRSTLDFRRVVVSNSRLSGQRLGDLELTSRFGVLATRIRRGDDDVIADDDSVLELGDRVRVVGPTEQLGTVARLLGDSERRIAEVDACGFALGTAAGLLVGTLAVPLPGGTAVELGAGGGPLLVGLALGVVARTGPITWQIPHAANLVLRQLGILIFLACAGLASGATFADAIVTRRGLDLALAGVIVAGLFAALVPLAAQLLLRRDVVAAAGMLAGTETQPAALTYANERTSGDERVTTAYALVFPVAMITKVLVVQFLV
jgi:putative transport protein